MSLFEDPLFFLPHELRKLERAVKAAKPRHSQAPPKDLRRERLLEKRNRVQQALLQVVDYLVDQVARDVRERTEMDSLINGRRLMLARELADFPRVKPHWVETATKRGVIPCYRVGRFRRYRPQDVLRALSQCQHGRGEPQNPEQTQSKPGSQSKTP